jgi:hypothetical protein
VTPRELRESPDVVKTFLDGEGCAPPDEIEAFARGLTLSQLFVHPRSVVNAAYTAHASIRSVESIRDAKDAARWLARNQAFVAGLTRCLELLQPQQDAGWLEEVDRVQLKVHICESVLVRGSKSDEALAEVRTEEIMKRKLEIKPRKA